MEKTLRGCPIGLRVSMTKEEMISHLQRKMREWKEEGFSDTEVKQAVIVKCKPLVFGFYWHRFPEACKNLEQALEELNIEVEQTIYDSAKKLRRVLNNMEKKEVNKNKTIIKEVKNFLEQF